MKQKEIIADFYSGVNWALLTLGASELVLILAGSKTFLITTFFFAVIFVFFLSKTQPGKKSLKKISRPLLFCTFVLIVGKWIYNYFVLLDFPETLILNLLAIIIFLLTGFITASLLPRFSNVTQ